MVSRWHRIREPRRPATTPRETAKRTLPLQHRPVIVTPAEVVVLARLLPSRILLAPGHPSRRLFLRRVKRTALWGSARGGLFQRFRSRMWMRQLHRRLKKRRLMPPFWLRLKRQLPLRQRRRWQMQLRRVLKIKLKRLPLPQHCKMEYRTLLMTTWSRKQTLRRWLMTQQLKRKTRRRSQRRRLILRPKQQLKRKSRRWLHRRRPMMQQLKRWQPL